ncbi:cysteine--tRNA ligase [archaeon]|nr:cysteine--tRNA ligase [archaeon]
MALKLYNTLTRKTQVFKPLQDNTVRLYTCGPTVYNYAHIGNLRTYIFEDILVRTLLYNNFKLKRVMNITDVGHLTADSDNGEEKMELGAKREGKTVWEVADFYTKTFMDDLKKLNILPPDIVCKATDNIKEQIELIHQLEKKGFTYEIPGDGIYYNTIKFKKYGNLAKLDIEGLKAGARVELVEGKKNPTDFALWKFSPKDQKRQMEWPSPWGVGFPGWHIECSAMATKYLGDHFDIHCGGIDHIPVHHTNEIAQIEAVTKKKWVNFWMHGEFLVLEKEKMAKSGDNFITLSVVESKNFDPLDYRYFCLSAHYKSKLNFSWEALEGARNAFKNLKNRIIDFRTDKKIKESGKKEKYQKKFLKCINEDLNMPLALAVMWEMLGDNKLGSNEKLDLLFYFDKVLGLNLEKVKEENVSDEIKNLVEQREQARKNKDWKRSDQIRDELKSKGIILEDTPEGVRWKKA